MKITFSNYNEILAKILTQDPAPPTVYRADLQPAVVSAVMRALVRDPQSRTPSAVEFFRDLLPFVDDRVMSRIILPEGVTVSELQRIDTAVTAPRSPAFVSDAQPERLTLDDQLGETVEVGQAAASRRWLFIGLVTIGVTVFGAVFGVMIASRDVPDPTPVPPAEAQSIDANGDQADAGTPVEQTDIAIITLAGVPEDAGVFLDGALVDDHELRLAKNGPMVRLLIEAEGYQPYRRMITPSRSRTVEVELVAEEEAEEAQNERPPRRPWRRRQ